MSAKNYIIVSIILDNEIKSSSMVGKFLCMKEIVSKV
jgi:hypothetical protein